MRSFQDSGNDGNGDLQGLISRLSYISNMGFGGIWTMPIFDSPSSHGYDTRNYYAIDSDYGTTADFSSYVTAAHNMGIKVVLDMVINHTADTHPWFLASQTNDPVYGSWYCWTNDSLSDLTALGWQCAWNNPTNTGSAGDVWMADNNDYYYAAFGSEMPDLNLKNPTVISQVQQIAGYWLTNGADGYRLDAVRYYDEDSPGVGQHDAPSTYVFVTNYEAALRGMKSGVFTVGEVATSYADSVYSRSEGTYYQGGNGLDMAFSFDFPGSVTSAINNASASTFNYLVTGKPGEAPFTFFAPILDNHDSFVSGGYRLMDNLGDDFNKAKLAAALQLTFPGTPFVYYGTEIGMMSVDSGDSYKRTPMQWDNTANAGFTTGTPWNPLSPNANPYNVAYQQTDPASLLNVYKNLIAFRKANTALTRGTIVNVTTGNSSVVSFIRPGTNVTILVVANLASSTNSVSLNFAGSGLSSSATYPMVLVPFLPDNTNAGVYSVGTNTNSSAVWSSMYVRGDFDGWTLSNQMSYQGSYVWTASVSLTNNQTTGFKFDTGSWTSGQNWGASGTAGLAQVNAGNISFTASSTKSYTFTFNQSTLAYSVQ